ncbi:MAG: hypothetical protein ACYDH1_17775 [Anaerolineaceae bacterium]
MHKAILFCILALLILTGCSIFTPATPTSTMPASTHSPTPSTTAISTNTATSTPTSTPTATSTATSIPTPTPTPTSLGGSGAIVYEGFSIQTDQGGPTGIIYFDLTTKSSTVLFEPGYHLLGTSPNRANLLLTKDHALFAVNIGSMDIIHSRAVVHLADNLFDQSPQAVWYENNRIVFIGWEGESRYLYQINSAGGEPQKMTAKGMRPVMLFPSNGLEQIYWASGSVTDTATGTNTNIQSYWSSAWDGSAPVELKIDYPTISPSLPLSAFFKDDDFMGTNLRLVIENLQNGEQVLFSEKFTEKHYAGGRIFWSASGQQLLAQAYLCTPGSGITCGTASDFFVFSKDGKFIQKLILPEMLDWINEFQWSPDEQMLVFENIVQPGTMHNKYLYNLRNDELIDLSAYFPEGLVFWRYFWVERP